LSNGSTKTHKFALRTKGLSDEEGGRLFYVIASAGRAFTEEYGTASNVQLKLLRSQYSDAEWVLAKRQDRLDLVG
jgi:hypothetical protein